MNSEPPKVLDAALCALIAQVVHFSAPWFDVQEMHLSESELEYLVCQVLRFWQQPIDGRHLAELALGTSGRGSASVGGRKGTIAWVKG